MYRVNTGICSKPHVKQLSCNNVCDSSVIFYPANEIV